MERVGSEERLEYVGSVLFRALSKTKRFLEGRGSEASYMSYGVVVPKEAALRLGWRPKQRVDLWVDEERRLLIVRAAETPPPPVLT